VAPTIRARLTLWYTAVLFGVLVFLGIWLYLVESRLRLGGVDGELSRAGMVVATGVADELGEEAALADAAPEVYKDLSTPGRVLAIHDAAGRRLAGTDLPGLVVAGGAADQAWTTVRRLGEDWRVGVQRHRAGSVTYYVVIGQPLTGMYTESARLRRTLLIGIPLALALAAAGGWSIARRALRPVSLMVEQAGRISGRAQGTRLRVPNPDDELGRLARAFNDLLGRLEAVLLTQRRFMADASHELRTPLSIARTAAEVSLARDSRGEPEYRETMGIVVEQTRRLTRMVDDMLTLARADAGGLELQPADLYLDDLLRDAVREATVLADERRVALRCAATTEVAYRGDERLLRQMVMNLLANGIRYAAANGHVEARLGSSNGTVEIAVADDGPGIPPEDRERIFERFVRLDNARGRPGGAGLGLPIARCIAEAHGGSLTLADIGPGSTFVVRLPRDYPLP
jgi:two-component system, OmpR family, sensor kinase